MRCSDIMLSVMLHAGIVAGAMYGLSRYENDPTDDDIIEPVFFEILEESVVAAADTPSKSDERERSLPNETPPPETPEEIEAETVPEPLPEEVEAETVPEPLPEESGSETPETVKENSPSERKPFHSEPSAEPLPRKPADQEVAKVVSAPVACARIVPKYPRSARRRGREGAVTLNVSVSDSGEVSGTEVLVSSGYGDLDEAAVSAVRSARFNPATEDGVRVSGNLRLTFEFKLR